MNLRQSTEIEQQILVVIIYVYLILLLWPVAVMTACFYIFLLMAEGLFNQHRRSNYQSQIQRLTFQEIDYMDGISFEYWVSNLLKQRGYRTRVTRASNDLGVDIVAERQDKKIAIQTKRQSQRVNRRAISDAVAGKAAYGCNYAMVVTNNYFSKGAIELARVNQCYLIDRKELERWVAEIQEAEYRRLEAERERLANLPIPYSSRVKNKSRASINSLSNLILRNVKVFTRSQRLILVAVLLLNLIAITVLWFVVFVL